MNLFVVREKMKIHGIFGSEASARSFANELVGDDIAVVSAPFYSDGKLSDELPSHDQASYFAGRSWGRSKG